jgi:hypothetical protein
VHLALAKHVHMDVVDGLAAFGVAVHDHAEAFLAALLDGQALGGEQDVAGQGLVFFGQVVEGADVFFGMTRKWTGAAGAMSLKARTWSSS